MTLLTRRVDNECGVLGIGGLSPAAGAGSTFDLGAPWAGPSVQSPLAIEIVIEPPGLGGPSQNFEVLLVTVIQNSSIATVVKRAISGTQVNHNQGVFWACAPFSSSYSGLDVDLSAPPYNIVGDGLTFNDANATNGSNVFFFTTSTPLHGYPGDTSGLTSVGKGISIANAGANTGGEFRGTIASVISSSSGTLSGNATKTVTSRTVFDAVTTAAATTIDPASDGASLPQGTITVLSTAGFPGAGALIVQSANGYQYVQYTGTTGTTFTGCTLGSGVLHTGYSVAAATITSNNAVFTTTDTGAPALGNATLSPGTTLTFIDAVTCGTSLPCIDSASGGTLQICFGARIGTPNSTALNAFLSDANLRGARGILPSGRCMFDQAWRVGVDGQATTATIWIDGPATTVDFYNSASNGIFAAAGSSTATRLPRFILSVRDVDGNYRGSFDPENRFIFGDGIFKRVSANSLVNLPYPFQNKTAPVYPGLAGQAAGRADAGCATNSTTTVTDTHILATDKGSVVTGTDIPANTVITAVVPGASFTISNAATGTHSGLSLTIQPYGLSTAISPTVLTDTTANWIVNQHAGLRLWIDEDKAATGTSIGSGYAYIIGNSATKLFYLGLNGTKSYNGYTPSSQNVLYRIQGDAYRGIHHKFPEVNWMRPCGYISQPTRGDFSNGRAIGAGQPDASLHNDTFGSGGTHAKLNDFDRIACAGSLGDFAASVPGLPATVEAIGGEEFLTVAAFTSFLVLGLGSRISARRFENNQLGGGIAYDGTTHASNRGKNAMVMDLASNFNVFAGGFNSLYGDRVLAIGAADAPATQTGGTYPSITFVSGVGQQVSATRDSYVDVPITYNPTGVAAATCLVEQTPDTTAAVPVWTTVYTITYPAGVSLDGSIPPLHRFVPAGGGLRLTTVNATIGTGIVTN